MDSTVCPEKGTKEQYVDRLAREMGLSYSVTEQGVLITGTEEAAQSRQAREESAAEQRRILQSFRGGMGSGEMAMPEFVETLERTLGIPVLSSEEVWTSSQIIVAPSSVQGGLDQFRALGFRWALQGGKLYLVK